MSLIIKTIKKISKYAILGMMIVVFIAINLSEKDARAAINPLINFSGKVTNIDGSELPDGVYDFDFKLYTQPVGGGQVWSEELSATTSFSGAINNLTGNIITYDAGASATSTLRIGQYLTNENTGESSLIVNYDNSANTITLADNSLSWNSGEIINNRPFVEGGVVNINMGAVTDLDNINFNQTLYLEVTFNGETMQPRKIITSVASALDTSRLGGKEESEFASLIEDEVITGRWDFNNILDVSSSSASTVLTVTQNGSGNIVEFKRGASTSFAVLADGRVQIGNYRFPTSYGSAGYVLKTNSTGDMYWGVDYIGAATDIGVWATSTDNLLILQSDTAQSILFGNISTSSPAGYKFEVDGNSWFDNIGISLGQEIRFFDGNDSNYIALKASSTLASNLVWILPTSNGGVGDALLYGSNGQLEWGAPSSNGSVNAGTQGYISYYASTGNALTATSTIFINSSGKVGIGTSTDLIKKLSVFGGGEFDELCLGTDCVSSWSGVTGLIGSGGANQIAIWTDANTLSGSSTLPVYLGGTGTTTFEQNSILYAKADNSIGEILATTPGYIMQLNGSGVPRWVATTSLGIDFNGIGGVLGVNAGGTGQDFSSDTGFIYLDNGIASASSTISITHTDLQNGSGLTWSDSRTLALDTSGDWSGKFDGLEGNEYFSLSAWYATTTDALTEGTINKYWTNQRFDTRLSATTSLPNITELLGLSSVGTIATGTWEGSVINVAYGGTGLSSITSQSLLFATTTDVISEFAIGQNGQVLTISGNKLVWSDTAASTPHDIFSAQHSDAAESVTLQRGDLMVYTASSEWDRLALGTDGFILFSNSGDPVWATTTQITSLGTVVQGVWNASTIEMGFGGTGATTATGARANLDLDEIYKFGINSTGTAGGIWQSDGDGRGKWTSTSSLGISSGGVYSIFVGTTTVTTNGYIASGTLEGYMAANSICDYEFPGSHFCQTHDIITTIEKDNDISDWGTTYVDAWIAEGPPGYTTYSNDCLGYATSSNIVLGAHWIFDNNGGAGWLANCSVQLPLTCCSWQ